MTDSTFDVEAFKREIADEVVARLRAERDREVTESVAAALRAEREREDWPLLSAKDVATRLGISERTARQMIADGTLPSLKTGGLTKVQPSALDEYLARQKGVA
jgi:excisionase family DNA binding protein